jgi:Protein of unknown function (DUF2795)
MSEAPFEQLNRYVTGVHYPTRREIVIEAAQRNGAPADVIEKLNHLLPRVSGPHEVQIALRRFPNDDESSYLSLNRFRSGPGLGQTTPR